MTRARLFVPLAVFALVVGVGFVGFSLNDPHQLPSTMLNKPFPEFDATLLSDPRRTVTRADVVGRPVLVNVWATWCPTCKAEHASLMEIGASTGLAIVGVNYKDDPAKARQWLQAHGDPYEFVIEDPDGSLAVDLGVYGAPESFLLDADGTIVYKRIGDINDRVWREELGPIVGRLLDG